MQLTDKEYRYYIAIPTNRDDIKLVIACTNDEERELVSAVAYPDFVDMDFYIPQDHQEPVFERELHIDGIGELNLKCYKAIHNQWN